jgi:hypothetical protein
VEHQARRGGRRKINMLKLKFSKGGKKSFWGEKVKKIPSEKRRFSRRTFLVKGLKFDSQRFFEKKEVNWNS